MKDNIDQVDSEKTQSPTLLFRHKSKIGGRFCRHNRPLLFAYNISLSLPFTTVLSFLKNIQPTAAMPAANKISTSNFK